MSKHPSLICAAGNTVVPSYLALKSKGYDVQPMSPGQDDETWWAEMDGMRFQADNVIELLGLVTMYEIRGVNWQAADDEITAFLHEDGNLSQS